MQKNQSEPYEKALYVEKSKNDILVENLFSSMPATVLNSLILAAVLWQVIPHIKIIVWCTANILYVFLRYAVLLLYKRDYFQVSNTLFKYGMILSFFIAGGLFGSSGIFLVDPSLYEYVVFIYFITGGMVVGSVGAYHNNLPVHFTYSGVVFFIPTISIYMMHGDTTTAMVLLGLIFYIVTSVSAIRLNRDLSEFLTLRYDNMELVTSLHNEKKNTEKLNQELVEKNRRLRELSLMDPLTGLRNRRYLFDIVTKDIENVNTALWQEKSGSSKRYSDVVKGYGLLIIDIDHFKDVNDTHGHDAGDMVLASFAKCLMRNVRSDDVVVRFGGEEFLIVLKNLEENYLVELAETLRENIAASDFRISSGESIPVTCSMGFVFYPFFKNTQGIISLDQIIYMADKALYHAKNNGRNCSAKACSTYSTSLDGKKVLEITGDIAKAIDTGKIEFSICTV